MYKTELIDIIEDILNNKNVSNININENNFENNSFQNNDNFNLRQKIKENLFFQTKKEFPDFENTELVNLKKNIIKDENIESSYTTTFYKYFTLKNTLIFGSFIAGGFLLFYYSPDIINFFFNNNFDGTNSENIARQVVYKSYKKFATNSAIILPQKITPYNEQDIIRFSELSLAECLKNTHKLQVRVCIFVEHMDYQRDLDNYMEYFYC